MATRFNQNSLFNVILIVLALVSASFVATARQVPKTKSKVSGRVIGPDNKPMAGATIKLQETTRHMTLNATSDNSGRFSLTDIPQGLYTPLAFKAGYVSRTSDQSDSAATTAIRIESDTELSGLELRLERGGVVTGKISDDGGDPVVLASVNVAELDGTSQRLQDFKVTQFFTDDRGVYRIFGLPAGRYLIKADLSKIASRSQQYISTYYPGVESTRQAAAVEVTPGVETKNIDFAIKRRGGDMCSITGRITRGEGQALSQASIWAYTDETGGLRVNTFPREDGSFEFKDIPSGNYTVDVITKDPLLVERTRTKVVASPSSTTSLNVVVEDGAGLMGSFEMEDGSQPKQAELLHVTAFAESLGYLIPGGQAVNGQFKILRLPSGPLQFAARTETTSYYVTKILYNNQVLTDGRLSVESGELLRGIRVILSEHGAALQGNVLRDNGSAHQGAAWVAVVPVEAERRNEPGLARFARVDQRGYYIIQGIAPGKYMALAYKNSNSVPANLSLLDSWLADRRITVPTFEVKNREQQKLNLRVID